MIRNIQHFKLVSVRGQCFNILLKIKLFLNKDSHSSQLKIKNQIMMKIRSKNINKKLDFVKKVA